MHLHVTLARLLPEVKPDQVSQQYSNITSLSFCVLFAHPLPICFHLFVILYSNPDLFLSLNYLIFKRKLFGAGAVLFLQVS